MQQFQGFISGKSRLISLPVEVFSELIPLIDDLDELKLTLFVMWALQQKDRDDYRYLRLEDFTRAEIAPMHGVTGEALTAALRRCVERGTLLYAEVILKNGTETLYFANTPAGRTNVEQIKIGNWIPGDLDNPVQLLPERPTIYKLYEDNIGSLTPMIIEDLKDTEQEFGVEWVREAIQISVQYGKRNLKYIRAILKQWKKEGKHEIREGHPDEKRSLTGRYADLFER